MHASLTAGTTILFRPPAAEASFPAFQWLSAAALWLAVAVVALSAGAHLEKFRAAVDKGKARQPLDSVG
jgi:hypothetical protein